MYEIQEGDSVTHKTITINNGLKFEVESIDNEKATCTIMEDGNLVTKVFDISDLMLSNKNDGGFYP